MTLLGEYMQEYDSALLTALRRYETLKLEGVEKITGNDECTVTMRRVTLKYDPSSSWYIFLLTLGLIPFYDEYQDYFEIEMRVKNNGLTAAKRYRYGYSTLYWLPLMPMALARSWRLQVVINDAIDDFFFNELPRAQAAAAHQD